MATEQDRDAIIADWQDHLLQLARQMLEIVEKENLSKLELHAISKIIEVHLIKNA